MRKKGSISLWNKEKAFGFIKPAGGDTVVFVHITAFQNRSLTPAVGVKLSYKLSKDEQGRVRATDVIYHGESTKRNLKHGKTKPKIAGLLGVLVLAIYASWILISVNQPVFLMTLLGWHCLISLITYMAYAKDKNAARNDEWRISEQRLHAYSLIGGWPGAIFAQQSLKHKSKKQSFRAILWITIIANISAVVFLDKNIAEKFLIETFKVTEIIDFEDKKAEIKWSNPG